MTVFHITYREYAKFLGGNKMILIKCPCCGIGWDIDTAKACLCGATLTNKSPQNLPKADAYSLLADVRADIQKMKKSDNADGLKVNEKWFAKGYNYAIDEIAKKISEHFR